MEVIVTCSNPPASESSIKSVHIESGTIRAIKSCGPYGIKSIHHANNCSLASESSSSYLIHMGSTSNKKDVYAALLENLPNQSLKWKCRLHSEISSPFITSHCGCFVLAGNTLGSICVWDNKGDLLSVTKAHYRKVTKLEMISNGGFVVSGGDDGIVHMWNLSDLCTCSNENDSDEFVDGDGISAIHSWSEHSLPVTSLCALPNNLMISASLDRLVVIMECCNGHTLAKISLPSAITVLEVDQSNYNRLFVGGKSKGLLDH